MKFSILAVILTISQACSNSTYPNENTNDFKKMEIHLVDSLGTISVNVPARFDTSFSWVHYSDCNICHIQKYRVQTKKTPILKESGFYYDEPNDSVDRFTISHNQFLPYHNNDTTIIFSKHSQQKDEIKFSRKGIKIIKDTIQKINGRYFSIFELENSDTVLKGEVLAITTINGNFINFSYEIMASKDDSLLINFFINSTKSINSIQIRSSR